ncbi:UNVERIFIED_CONTAM: hypothetical protein GTU68_050687 [Idotea baltica]|nr:hypothetical protein [Idotea baltica]
METIKLTQYSHGAGCGCKISPAILNEILANNESTSIQQYSNLIVGNDHRDDAAVMDIGNGIGIISTTDFFMPIVDDAFTFGQIASVNAISDIYAMGGTPLMAIGILGWPINKIGSEVANQVMAGAKKTCAEAGIPLAGGHSIDSPEPIFGLAVTGQVEISGIKTNAGAKPGDVLYLTKPLGVGILSTAQKKAKLKPEHSHLAIDSMVLLNKIGERLAGYAAVHALTDVTGFGLLGHLNELCVASEVNAEIIMDQVPILNKHVIDYYLEHACVPGGTNRNWDSYGQHVGALSDYQKNILCDPQTSGGLLIAVDSSATAVIEDLLSSEQLNVQRIGHLTEIDGADINIHVR